ncbi:CoA transferase [Bosea sp. LjRoot9]|uniref:CaiB/BaiF CoA transferase family protein n=1 Tax=Bosea sp. LjRoot9 TaxID=3342341 RepID=UPI003ECF0796
MKPLSGIRIADFTVHAAGPFCTHMLSQLGAECIKIESALRPDIFRKPHPVYGRNGPASFDQVASNKLSVRINLKHPEGIALAKRLVAVSDVAAESFRPGVMARLGLSYDALCAVKPDIVLVSVSSSGQTGPDSHFAGYAPLFGAWGGLGYLTGYADGPPVEMRHVMDHSVGLNAAMATMAALLQRRRSGKGTHVDVAAREVASSLIGEALLEAATGGAPRRMGNDDLRMAPHGVFPSRDHDRWLTIAVGTDRQWAALAGLIEQAGRSVDPCFAAAAYRQAHGSELDTLVASWTKQQDATAAAEVLQRAGIPAHVSWTTRDIVEDEHLQARNAIVHVAEPDGRMRAAVGVPMRFSRTSDVGIARGTPRLGEDEDYVFGELLGIGRAERQRLVETQVIF